MPRPVWMALTLMALTAACAEVKPPQQAEERVLEAPVATASQDVDVLTTSIGLKLKRLPGGTFLMGASPEEKEARDDERPQHRVTISRPFYIGIYEVTQGEYKQIMGNNPSSEFQDSDQQSVEQVSWYDAVRFCNKLSEREGRMPYYEIWEGRKPYYEIEWDEVTLLGGNGFRLPTEAEWEYACRAGSEFKYSFGDNAAELSRYAWFDEPGDKGKTHPVGKKQPNRWGLYDMHGNVWEWCQDEYFHDYYKNAPPVDPPGPSKDPGVIRRGYVIRGGNWNELAVYCRSAFRDACSPEGRSNGLGFRVAAGQAKP